MIDPRVSVINDRLKGVRHTIAVSSGKGGVGKSLIASALALTLSRSGYNVGLFDADFTGPSTHVILGLSELRPKEGKGLIPTFVHGLNYMSVIHCSRGRALPLRGSDVSNALIELLSVTKWGALDFLIIDMPPGIGDATLDALRFIKGAKFLVVTTPSPLALETVKKLIDLLMMLNVPVVGVIENMKIKPSELVKRQVTGIGIRYLGEIPFDAEVDDAVGDVDALMRTDFAKKLGEIASSVLGTFTKGSNVQP